MISFVEVERLIDGLADSEKVRILDDLISNNRIVAGDQRSCLLVLANSLMLLENYVRAEEIYRLIGFEKDAMRARSFLQAI